MEPAIDFRAYRGAVNDFEMYYEIRGEGEPLILLHGGGGAGANWQLIFKDDPTGYTTGHPGPARPREINQSLDGVDLPAIGERCIRTSGPFEYRTIQGYWPELRRQDLCFT